MEETNTILLIIQEITEGLLETLSFHEHFEKENMVFSTVIIANFLPSEFLIYTCYSFFYRYGFFLLDLICRILLVWFVTFFRNSLCYLCYCFYYKTCFVPYKIT